MMLYNMGAWVFMSFIHILLLPSSLQESMGKVLDGDSVISAEKEIDLTDTIHGAVPDSHLKMSTADHQPYDVLVYNLDYSDALNAYSEVKHRPRDTKAYQNTYSVSEDSILEHGEFSSVENDEKGNLNQGTEYLETSGFEPLSSVTSINLEDPKQIETIRTQSYHREVPYDIGNFQTNQHDGEGHAEIHYHEHKHLHKHNHKQDHLHKHRQEHSHKHGHAHEDRSHHEHKHDSDHKHIHHSQHNHDHKNGHRHRYLQDHNRSHNGWYQHSNKRQEEHEHSERNKHNHYNTHKHTHNDDHKHGRQNEHKDDKHHHHGNQKRHHEHKNSPKSPRKRYNHRI